MEEGIRLYAKMNTDDENFVFPDHIYGQVQSCTEIYTGIPLPRIASGAGFAVYQNSDYHARNFAGLCYESYLDFDVTYGKLEHYQVYANQVRFEIDQDEVQFINSLPINNNFGMPSVCYPFEEHLAFGLKVIPKNADGWPLICPGQELTGFVHGYRDGNNTFTASGIIYPDYFTTGAAQDDYYVYGYDFREENLHYNWTVAVDDGPERTALPAQSTMKVFHGFKADPIVFTPPLPAGDTVTMGDEVNIVAVPYPYLLEQERITYHWFWEGTGDLEGQGHFQYGIPTIYKSNKFFPDYPGDISLRYEIRDANSSTWAASPEPDKVIHIKPQLHILIPADQHKFKYDENSQPFGEAALDFQGAALPTSMNEDIEWTLTPIAGVQIASTIGIPAVGESGIFFYRYLPEHNDDFGAKEIKAQLREYSAAESHTVLLFFMPQANNNPEQHHYPNWFYYWKDGAVVPTMNSSDVAYLPTTMEEFGHYDPENDFISLSRKAADICRSYPIPGFGHTFEEVSGIHLCANTLKHERYHQEIYNNWREPAGKWFQAYGHHPFFNPQIPANQFDLDSDGLPNTYEDSISNVYGFFRLDPINSDSYGLEALFGVPIYGDIGDQELLARFFAEGSRGHVQLDWSSGQYGKQW